MTNTTLRTASTLASSESHPQSYSPLQLTIYREFPLVGVFPSAKQFPLTFTSGDVQTFNNKFVEILEDIRAVVQKGNIDLSDNDNNYLTTLRDLGEAAYNQLLHENLQSHIQVKEKEFQAHDRGLSLTFTTPPEYPLFWEMLYSGESLEIEPEKFWGFAYPIGRIYWEVGNISEDVYLQNGAFSVIHHRLKSSQAEINFLEEKLRDLKINFQSLEGAISQEDICIENLLKYFHDENFHWGIIHFACHCINPLDQQSLEACLSITAHQNQLEIELEKLLSKRKFGFKNRPFIFLNACESATPGKLLQTLSFPTGMLNFGAGGVIATACTIPDNFASAFAKKFYEILLIRIKNNTLVNLGGVLLETRRFFLKHYNNPLGLAYGLYALSNQKLRLMD